MKIEKLLIYKSIFELGLGFGTLRLPLKEGHVDKVEIEKCIDYYIKNGGVYFETAYSYFESEKTIRDNVVKKYPREKIYIADKLPISSIISYADQKSIFEEQLRNLSIDYFDFYLIHNINESTWEKVIKYNTISFLQQQKNDGKIIHLGFSFHGGSELLEKVLSEFSDLFDFVQLQINCLDWNSPVIQSKDNYGIAEKYGLPVFVMEPLKGGRLCNLRISDGDIISSEFAFDFVRSLPNVVCILSGMNKLEQVVENVSTFRSEVGNHSIYEEKAVLLSLDYNKNKKIQCTNCRYCTEVCPSKIPIPEIFSLFECDNVSRVGGYYGSICKDKGKASDCIKCGRCEKVCSQRIDIRHQLEEIAQIYEKRDFRYILKISIVKVLKRIGIYGWIRRIQRG